MSVTIKDIAKRVACRFMSAKVAQKVGRSVTSSTMLESQGYTVLTSPKASNDYWLGSYIVFKSGVGESLIPRNEIKPAE